MREEALPGAPALWLPQVELDDYECRKHLPAPVINWTDLRSSFQELTQHTLDAGSLQPVIEDAGSMAWRKALQVAMLGQAAVVMLRFAAAVVECPVGAATAALFTACLAHLPREDVSEEALPPPFERVLVELGRQSFISLAARDLRLLLEIAPLHVVVAAEWNVFAMLNFYIGRLRQPVAPGPPAAATCPGAAVAGHSSEEILRYLSRHLSLASGKSIAGLKFLRGMDDMVTSIMRDPTEFSADFVQACPAGAAGFATAAAMLALMSNPSLFERFANLAHYVLRGRAEAVLAGAHAWGVFHALAKLAIFATRSYDLVWSMDQLLPVPGDALEFDALRLDVRQRSARLAAASSGHPNEVTRALSTFLLSSVVRQAAASRSRAETVVYLTAAGGLPFSDYIEAFVRRAVAVNLPALIIICMDPDAFSRCKAAAGRVSRDEVHCVPEFEGHVVLVKHAFIPVLLSAAVDVVWIDFDTFILRDPTSTLLEARDRPGHVLPERSRVRFGSFLFQNASDMCNLTKICDSRQQWAYNISGQQDMEETPQAGAPDSRAAADLGVEVLVTEHWDARCLNNGLFYVRASHRPLVFFTTLLAQLYTNPYTDNQNLFDAFLGHSTLDSAAPDTRPLLRYALLDIEHHFACAEGHMGTVSGIVTFHFWSSDFKTREVTDSGTEMTKVSMGADPKGDGDRAGGGNEPSAIRLRDGKERVSKTTATKSELFDLFFGSANVSPNGETPAAGAAFIESVKAPPPNWKGMCSVTAVGIEDLIDERVLQQQGSLLDWKQATGVPHSSDAPASALVGEGQGLQEVRLPSRPAESTEGPQCNGIPLKEWAEGLRQIAGLEDAALLSAADAAALKARLRCLEVGTLLVLQAFGTYGRERLALELRAALAQHSTCLGA